MQESRVIPISPRADNPQTRAEAHFANALKELEAAGEALAEMEVGTERGRTMSGYLRVVNAGMLGLVEASGKL